MKYVFSRGSKPECARKKAAGRGENERKTRTGNRRKSYPSFSVQRASLEFEAKRRGVTGGVFHRCVRQKERKKGGGKKRGYKEDAFQGATERGRSGWGAQRPYLHY